ILTALFIPVLVFAGEKRSNPPKKDPEQKIVQAVRAEEPIEIDGELKEKVWQTGGYSDFIQSDPVDGGPPSEKTRVWVAYDRANLYVAAFLYDSEPQAIKKLLGRRDDFVDSDWFTFAVDPYYDRRSGYEFSVNPAGSIIDLALSNDVSEDETWDGVWDWKTQINGQGWTVEIRIPLNQLRFPKRDESVWGVNFGRKIMRKQEKIRFVWVPKEDIAYVSRFARLEGIRDIDPGTHIEFLPYSVGQAQYKPAEKGNPFQTGHAYRGNAGFDLKVGLKSNLTLDATVNPDFGQVEVDPAVINLSAYETYYEEKRPFFIEGASLFKGFGRGGIYFNANINWPNPELFYSRRVGRTPQGIGAREEGFVDSPDRTTILGAAKVTGKLGGGWNVGFLSAVTAREFARIEASGRRRREEVEPFSWYGVFRAQKDIQQGQRGYGIIATGVDRDLRSENLGGILNKNAYSAAIDGWTFLDKKRIWVVGGWFGGTSVEGGREDILRLQRSSMHYYQRPDATHVELDPNATTLSGWGGRFSLAKQQGNFLFLTQIGLLSPGFNPNDAGFQYSSSDKINITVLPAYQWTKPGKVFRNAILVGGPFRNYDFGGNKTWDGYLLSLEGTLVNYWYVNVMAAYNPRTMSNSLTRGGPLALMPRGYQIDAFAETDGRKPVVFEASTSFYRRPGDGSEWMGGLEARWKPKSNINISFEPEYSIQKSEIQWVTRVEDPLMTSTYGSRYVFGRIDQKILSSEIRLNWIFTPKMTLQLYLQPFIAVGRYDKFKELARPKAYAYNVYGDGGSTVAHDGEGYRVDPDGGGPAKPFTIENPDFNVKSLRGTAVLRWEYRPGSLLYLVWTQNRADYAHPGEFRLRRDLGDLLTAPGDNIFLLKVSYRWSL
ncbi:MAG TPA: DUF5916 domain-containing protein, partial [Candidatus Aminicenantes bacterium]|nr:DUF5916 domain-containing protein [Candidatus Aminicenantes bacterium]